MTNRKPRGRPRHDDILTPAEWRIVEGVRHGMTSRQIAEKRNISIDAVKYHVANVLQKVGLSNRTELRAWDGVSRTSALRTKEGKMTGKSNLGPIGQISRTVGDIEQATSWYAETLGLVHLYSFNGLAFFDCQGVRLFLNQGDGQEAQDSVIYFQVDDIHGAKADLESRGVIFTNAPHMIHKHDNGVEEWMAFFVDPDGKPLALISQTPISEEN